MRFSRSEAVALFGWLCLTPLMVAQQTGDPQSTSSQNASSVSGQNGGTSQKQLTPEEQRQKAIEAIDPLAKDPNANKRSDPRMNQLPNPDQNSGQDSGSVTKPRRTAPAIPGSIAASNEAQASAEGPQIVAGSSDTDPQYNGPAVLSRTYTLQRPLTTRDVQWSWEVTGNEFYTTGLISGVAAAPGQEPPTVASFGEGFSWGFHGRHAWKHDQLGISYGLNYNNYGGVGSYNGFNQNLSLDYTHFISRNLQLNFVQTLTRFTQGGSLQNPLLTPGVSAANLNLAVSPSVQPFDLTSKQSNTQVSLTWQKSARLSFNYSAGLFGVQMAGVGLFGESGFQGSTDVNYRLTRKTTVGVSYAYTTYTYSHHFAVADSHTVDMIYSYALNRSTQLRSRLGVSMFSNSGIVQVPVDPSITALTGQSVALVETRRMLATPDVSVQLIKDFHNRHTASVSYAAGISPGNGLILTAIQKTYSGSYGTILFRRYNLALSAGKSVLGSALPNQGNFNSEYGGLTVSRPLSHNVSANFAFNYRKYVVSLMPVAPQIVVSTGISWGPGEGRLW